MSLIALPKRRLAYLFAVLGGRMSLTALPKQGLGHLFGFVCARLLVQGRQSIGPCLKRFGVTKHPQGNSLCKNRIVSMRIRNALKLEGRTSVLKSVPAKFSVTNQRLL